MKKCLCALIFLSVLNVSAFGYSAAELKRMSTFVSNFTETGMCDFNTDSLSDNELANFGIWHNYRNNFKSRIQRCPDKNCSYGSLIVDKSYVAESVRKYFDLEINHRNVDDERWLHYDGRVYHFEGADGESVQARVYEAENRGNIIIMRGETYYPDNDELEGSPFTARAKPYRYNGKNTWAIISLKVED